MYYPHDELIEYLKDKDQLLILATFLNAILLSFLLYDLRFMSAKCQKTSSSFSSLIILLNEKIPREIIDLSVNTEFILIFVFVQTIYRLLHIFI